MSTQGLLLRRRRRPEMNLLPLIDVLVMLIFFAFVTMQFRSAATLNITLPKVDTAGKNEFKGTVTIGIDKVGDFSFNGRSATFEQIGELLDAVREADRDIPVLIRADEETPLRFITMIVDACRKRGLSRTPLQTR